MGNSVSDSAGFKAWFGSRKVQRILVMVAFMIIPLILLFVFTYLPFGEMIGFSFYKMKYIGKKTFVGLKNYASVLYVRFISTVDDSIISCNNT